MSAWYQKTDLHQKLEQMLAGLKLLPDVHSRKKVFQHKPSNFGETLTSPQVIPFGNIHSDDLMMVFDARNETEYELDAVEEMELMFNPPEESSITETSSVVSRAVFELLDQHLPEGQSSDQSLYLMSGSKYYPDGAIVVKDTPEAHAAVDSLLALIEEAKEHERNQDMIHVSSSTEDMRRPQLLRLDEERGITLKLADAADVRIAQSMLAANLISSEPDLENNQLYVDATMTEALAVLEDHLVNEGGYAL